MINISMENCPLEPSFNTHWLAVEGVQPKIPQNYIEEEGAAPKLEASSTREKPLVKHVLSEEMQLYYKTVTEAIAGNDFELQQAAYRSLSGDPGLHQLLPYLSQFIYDEVKQNLTDLRVMSSVLRAARCLLTNPSLHIELYVRYSGIA